MTFNTAKRRIFSDCVCEWFCFFSVSDLIFFQQHVIDPFAVAATHEKINLSSHQKWQSEQQNLRFEMNCMQAKEEPLELQASLYDAQFQLPVCFEHAFDDPIQLQPRAIQQWNRSKQNFLFLSSEQQRFGLYHCLLIASAVSL